MSEPFLADNAAVRRRTVFGGLAIALLVAIVWAGATALAIQRRDQAVADLMATAGAASNGQILDLSEAFTLPWDRAVVLGPYTFGSDANDALGFEHYPADDVMTQGDGVHLLVFIRDQQVVAEVALYGQAFYFDESIETFDAEAARFRVLHDDSGTLLVPVES